MAQQTDSVARAEKTIVESRVVSPPRARVVETVTVLSKSAAERLETKGRIPEPYVPWGEDGDWFHVGARIAPAGISAARNAILAKRAGDEEGVVRHARAALAADRFANGERAAGRTAKRSNVSGNAWSAWYQAITGHPAP